VKRITLGLLLLLGCGLPARAQFTTATATVRDPSGNPYVGCHGEADFVPSPTATQVPLLSGSTFQQSVPISGCDSFGTFSMVLADNTVVSDGHTGATASKWSFSICSSNTPPVCFTATITITGATQNISAALQAAAAPLPVTAQPAGLTTVNNFTNTNNFAGTTNLNGPLNTAGPNVFSGTTTLNNVTSINTCLMNGMYVAGSSCYATIVAAENAACGVSPNGTVYIPAIYVGTDTFSYNTSCAAGYPSLIDMRRSNISFSTVISPTFPSTDNAGRSLPLGADFNFYSGGASDFHFKHGLVATTTTATINIGANASILIAAVT